MDHAPVTLSYRLTDAEERAAERLTVAGWIRQLVLVAATAAIAIANLGGGDESVSDGARIGAAVIVAVLFYGLALLAGRMLRKLRRRDQVVHAFDLGIRARFGELEVDRVWPLGGRLVENRQVLVVLWPRRPGLIVPKRAFTDPEAMDALRALVADRLAHAADPYAARGPLPTDADAPSDEHTLRLRFPAGYGAILRGQLVLVLRPNNLLVIPMAAAAGAVVAEGARLTGALVGVGLYALLFVVLVVWSVVRSPMERTTVHQRYREDGFELYGGGMRVAGPWSLVQWAGSGLGVQAVLVNGLMFVTPDEAFASPAELDRFRALLPEPRKRGRGR